MAEGWVKFVWNRKIKHQIVSVSDINPNPLKLESTIQRKIEESAQYVERKAETRAASIRKKNKYFSLVLSF
jgi:hypothetical protein